MAKVTVHRPSIYPFNGLTLTAGINDVSNEDLKMLKSQKGVLRDVERGILSFDGNDEKTPRKQAVKQTDDKSE
jgi:hypothetical protein